MKKNLKIFQKTKKLKRPFSDFRFYSNKMYFSEFINKIGQKKITARKMAKEAIEAIFFWHKREMI